MIIRPNLTTLWSAIFLASSGETPRHSCTLAAAIRMRHSGTNISPSLPRQFPKARPTRQGRMQKTLLTSFII